MASVTSILGTLTTSELKELCKRYGLRGYSGLDQKKLASFVAKNAPIAPEELIAVVESLQSDKLLSKVRDGRDHFLMKQVELINPGEDVIEARVGGYAVVIADLGTEEFWYRCDEKCYDFLYQVQKGRYPFCKHYPSVVAELVFRGLIDVSDARPNLLSDAALKELLGIVEQRRRQEAIVTEPYLSPEEIWQELDENLLRIARQGRDLARNVYRDTPERVFEDLLDKAFNLLQFETIARRKEHGWDLILIDAYADPAYLAVVEAKTSSTGIYDHMARQPDYMYRLKSYCIDMVKNRLVGALRDYVRYMVVVAPGFPSDVENICERFKLESGGIHLSFLPVPSLLRWIRCQLETPIRIALFERLFARGGVISEEDIDRLYLEGDLDIRMLADGIAETMKKSLERLAEKTVDARFMKMDSVLLAELFRDIAARLEPALMKIGRDEVTGITTYNVKHDNYAVWGKVLHSAADAFQETLQKYYALVSKRSELKEHLLRLLE